MTPTRLAGLGAFVIGGILLFAIGLFLIGERRMLFVDKFVVFTEFTKVSGLQPGASVTVNGMPAGEVETIAVPVAPGGRFRVRFNVREDLHTLVRTDSIASIQTEGLVGGTFLEITAGSGAAPRVPDRGAIPSREPFEVADLLVQMSDTVRLVNETIEALRGDVETAVSEVAATATHADALLQEISDDVAGIAGSSRRIIADAQAMMADVRGGRGTIGKLATDDALYQRAVGLARETEGIVQEARRAVQESREVIAGLRSGKGPVQGVATELRDTLGHAREALADLEENSEALKRNFFFRGYFKRRGYYDLDDISPADYRRGVLEKDDRRALRIWLDAAMLFEPDPGGGERLSEGGRTRVESAMGAFVKYGRDTLLIVEGYATGGSTEEQYLASRRRASIVRDYVLRTFHRDSQTTGIMPLSAEAPESPDEGRWDGVAIAVFPHGQ